MSWGGFAAGLAVGAKVGKDWVDQYKETQLKRELGDAAAKSPSMTEQESGADALQHARDSFTPQEGGPQTFDEYLNANPDFARAALPQLSKQQAGYDVGGKFYGGRDEADAAVRRGQSQALADVYRANGDPEKALRLEASGQEFEARGLQLKGARRQDANEEYKAKLDDLIRNQQDMDTPTFLSKAAEIASNGKADGQGFVWGENPDGTFTVGQHDRSSRKIVGTQQFDGDRAKLIQELVRYSSADKFEEARKEAKADTRDTRDYQLKKDELNAKIPVYESTAALNRAHAGLYNRMPVGGGGGGLNLTDAQATALNASMIYEEQAKQLAKTNPAAAQEYRNAAIRALESLPPKVQLAMHGKLGNAPQQPLETWDQLVEVKTTDPKTGTEIKRQVPLRVADPEGYKSYLKQQGTDRMFEDQKGKAGVEAPSKPTTAGLVLKPLGTDASGKTVLSYDDYSALRSTVDRMAGRGSGATSPDYWKLKEQLDNSTYRLY